MNYELLYLVASSKEAQLDKIKQEVADLVTSEGGIFEEKQVVEKRKLAYEVQHEKYGFYVAQRFSLDDLEKFKALNKRLNLSVDILRFLISRAEDLPELMSRKEREEKTAVAKEFKKEATPRESKEVAKSIAKPAPTAQPEKPAKKTEEDIDKKLEEILNI